MTGATRAASSSASSALARSHADIERTDLQMRERELLTEHSAEWVVPLSSLGDRCRLQAASPRWTSTSPPC
jgi:hypothetical protein